MLSSRHLFLTKLRALNWGQIWHRWKAWRSYQGNFRRLEALILDARRNHPSRRVICISKVFHMGDILACEPVARQVRNDYPDAFIIWCLQMPYSEIIRHHPAVDYILAVECIGEWMLFANSPLFDRVIDLEMNGKPCKHCNLALHKADDFGVTFDNYFNLGSLLDVYLRCANATVKDRAPQIFIPDAIRKKVEALVPAGRRFVTIHCHSNEICKDWTREKWTELLAWMTRNFEVEFIEIGTNACLGGSGLPGYQSKCGRLSILETAEIIRRSTLFIGVESGPAHLANAVGTKGVILIGRYVNFKRYMPYAGRYADPEEARIVYSSNLAAEIPVADVQEAIASLLPSVERISQACF